MSARGGQHAPRLAVATAAALLALGHSCPARAGFTETAPEGTMVVDLAFNQSWLTGAYDNEGEFGPLIDEIWRYEPGGGLQGVLIPKAKASYSVLITQLNVGILDELTLGIGIPLVLNTTVDPQFEWVAGDYQWGLGRSYSQEDFWQWASSMGQPEPGVWTGNNGVMSDTVLGARLRWTDWFDAFQSIELASALQLMYAIPTGTPADPEEPVASGTTMWELQSQGDLVVALGIDKTFDEQLDGRLTLGVEGFYGHFFPRDHITPRGTKHPLLLNYAPYVGDTYEIDPGDFSGLRAQVDVVPYKGPEDETWITEGDPEQAKSLPPVLSFWIRYSYTHIQQSDWSSNSPIWDWDREEVWRPGYKNALGARINVGLLRVGVPFILYVGGKLQSVLPGKNARVADLLQFGLQAPVPLWSPDD